jgi:hypothetical protein
MVCNEVRERLSEYLDDVLPIEKKTRVDEHLSACAECRRELASLKTVVRELHTLHQVAPPDGFLEQLHGRLTARPWHQRVLRSFFLPLRFKIPIQVAGAITVALLVFSILTLRQDERDRILRPSVAEKQEMKRDETGTMAKRSAPPKGVAGPGRAGSQAETEEIREKQETAPSENLLSDEAAGIGAMTDQQRVMALVLRIPMNRFSEAQERASDKAVESEGVRFRAKEKAPVDPLFHELKALAARHHGHMLAAVYDEGSGKLDSVEIEIPSSQYEGFFEGLKGLGDMEPSPPLPEGRQGAVKVSIKVVMS